MYPSINLHNLIKKILSMQDLEKSGLSMQTTVSSTIKVWRSSMSCCWQTLRVKTTQLTFWRIGYQVEGPICPHPRNDKALSTETFLENINFTILSTDRFSEVMSRQQMLEFKTLHETFTPSLWIHHAILHSLEIHPSL